MKLIFDKYFHRNEKDGYRWYRCSCYYCGRPIKVRIKKSAIGRNPRLVYGNACYDCIPQYSIMRNGFDESAFETKNFRFSL